MFPKGPRTNAIPFFFFFFVCYCWQVIADKKINQKEGEKHEENMKHIYRWFTTYVCHQIYGCLYYQFLLSSISRRKPFFRRTLPQTTPIDTFVGMTTSLAVLDDLIFTYYHDDLWIDLNPNWIERKKRHLWRTGWIVWVNIKWLIIV